LGKGDPPSSSKTHILAHRDELIKYTRKMLKVDASRKVMIGKPQEEKGGGKFSLLKKHFYSRRKGGGGVKEGSFRDRECLRNTGQGKKKLSEGKNCIYSRATDLSSGGEAKKPAMS